MGGCEFFQATGTVPAGYCSYDPISTQKCDYCEWLACAEGDYYASLMDCQNDENAKCSHVFWESALCEVP